ncbi:MAG TPA: glycosyltransferase [Candidatus Acidoferrales bacterium]|nr:glycosyltransferase [Candidatus Acidoferrales bacterium]
MRIVMFYHSLVSDWNHGNAHFLRGVATEFVALGHELRIYEPENAWSVRNLIEEAGEGAIREFHRAYPLLHSVRYGTPLDLDEALDGADLVLVHEWNEPQLIAAIGRHKRSCGNYRLFFHDTHHRSVTEPRAMARYDLSEYDGVLAFGETIRDTYLRNGWAKEAWTWHEAADVRVFRPHSDEAWPLQLLGDGKQQYDGDLVWIGNWGDDERAGELREFLFDPAKELGLRARVHGVRYPPSATAALAEAGIEYAGWLPNYEVPRVFSRFRVTVHIPRRPYVESLPGIPTIRVFEALACGIPLVCSPWQDSEHLFTPGKDYLVARDGREMKSQLRELLANPSRARELAEHGRRTILDRHRCAHRASELLAINELKAANVPALERAFR